MTTHMRIRLRAGDTLFFRNAKPFNLGAENTATGIFPPPHSVIYGALRSAWFAQSKESMQVFTEKVNTDADNSLKLKINSVLLNLVEGEDNYILYPLPADIAFGKEEDDNNQRRRIPLQLRKAGHSSAKTDFVLHAGDKAAESLERAALTAKHIQDYLNGKEESITYKDYSIITKETKIGIGISRETGAVKEGQLYKVEMLRLESQKERIEIIVDFEWEGVEFKPEGVLRLGAEGKTAQYSLFEKDTTLKNEWEVAEDECYCKLYLATPAIFTEGWLPEGLQPVGKRKYEGEIKGVKIKNLLAAAIPGYQALGGYHMQTAGNITKGPKPLRRAVPAGSVYYLQTEPGGVKKLMEELYGKCLGVECYTKLGYGLSYIGKLDFSNISGDGN